jgi:hypothetical protein
MDNFFKAYLNKLSNHFTRTDLKFFQIKLYNKFLPDDDLREAMNTAPSFFKAVKDSYWKDIIITLFNLYDISSDAKRTIPHFLNRFYHEYNSLDIKDKDFNRNQVLDLKESIGEISDELEQVRIHRHNLYAHFDKKYFDEPFRINEDTDLNYEGIDRILENAHQILFKIHGGYRDVHRELKIYSRGDFERVVQNLRIFNNWKNNPQVRALLMEGKIGLK